MMKKLWNMALLANILLWNLSAFGWDVDLRSVQSAVKDQCDRNTCAYFSCTSLLESLVRVEFNQQVNLSEQFIIYLSKTKFENKINEEHADPYQLLLQFKSQSRFYTQEDIPYEQSYFRKGGPCEKYVNTPELAPAFCFSQELKLNLDAFNSKTIFGLEVDHMSQMWTSKKRSEIIMDRLDEQRSVVITVKVNPDHWDHKTGKAIYTQEIEDACNAGEAFCAGHAILLVGYDKEKKQFLFKNSWGTKWGKEGYGTIDFDYIEKFSEQPYSLQFNRFIKDYKD